MYNQRIALARSATALVNRAPPFRSTLRIAAALGVLLAAGSTTAPSAAGPSVCSHTKTPPARGPAPPRPAGRYFDPGSPKRQNLLAGGVPGVRLTLSGHVNDESCHPVTRALLDFFEADNRGHYDRTQRRLHGHQYTDARGRYLLRTIVPNHYLRRAPHIHAKVEAPGGPVLDTELFFPATVHAYGMRIGLLNARDPTDRQTNGLLAVRVTGHNRTGYTARFDFVIAVT
jgi:protocatechuate 3,4-dioxygenase beta subunit